MRDKLKMFLRLNCNKILGGALKRVSDGVLIGIVSFGSTECADPTFPGVYSRVASARSWIKSNSGV